MCKIEKQIEEFGKYLEIMARAQEKMFERLEAIEEVLELFQQTILGDVRYHCHGECGLKEKVIES